MVAQHINGDATPNSLRGLARWFPYVATPRPGKPGKTDKKPATKAGKPLPNWGRPEAWMSYEQAKTIVANNNKLAGVGLCMTGIKGIVGIDLDNCIEAGVPNAYAQNIIAMANSYTEISPSGTGVRIFVRGEISRDYFTPEVEVYGGHGGRFLTVTGDRMPGTHADINPAPQLLGYLEETLAPAGPKATAAPVPVPFSVGDISDAGLPPHAQAFLVDGDIPAHGDGSRALFAAACALTKRYDDETAFSYLMNSDPAWAVATNHRPRSDDAVATEAAMAYLWDQVRTARAKLGPLVPELDDFADLGAPDVEAPPFDVKATITEDPVAPVSLGFAAVEFTHDGVLPVGVTLIAGGHGSGKTSLLVSLACIETGELDGTDGGVGVELKRHSIYMAEDVGQVHRIRHGLIKHEGMVPNGRFHVVQSRRMSVEQVKAFITKCIERFTIVHESGHLIRPHITFDTTNACFDVQDENSASEVGAVMAAIKETSKGAPVWIVGHLPKAMLHGEVEGLTARGSGAWEADAQTTAFVVHADAKDLDNDVRWLVTKKRRFEAEYTEIRFETYTGTETVPTPWGSLQTLGYRYGVPSRAARGERKAAKEAAKEDKQTEHMVVQAQKATEYLMRLLETHGEVWMRQGAKGGGKPPLAAEGKHVATWEHIWTYGVTRPSSEKLLRATVYENFEPFEGWGKLVPRPEGSLW